MTLVNWWFNVTYTSVLTIILILRSVNSVLHTDSYWVKIQSNTVLLLTTNPSQMSIPRKLTYKGVLLSHLLCAMSGKVNIIQQCRCGVCSPRRVGSINRNYSFLYSIYPIFWVGTDPKHHRNININIYIYIYIYIYMTVPRFAVGQCRCVDEEYQCSRKQQFQHYLLFVIISTGRPLPHLTIKGGRGRHKRHQRYNYSYHQTLY